MAERWSRGRGGLGTAGRRGPAVPDGFPLPTPRLVASVQFETVPSSEQFVAHELLQFGSEDDLVRFNLALESCLGRQ